MKELVNIQDLNQAKVLLNPIRISILDALSTPKTCAQLSEILGLTQQRTNNHLKELLKVRLIRVSARKKIRNLIEATYEAQGKSYWFSPKILNSNNSDKKYRDQLSLSQLLLATENVQDEVAKLLEVTENQEIPSISISSEIYLPSDKDRNAFAQDLLKALEVVFNKYSKNKDNKSTFIAHLMCYPKVLKKEGKEK